MLDKLNDWRRSRAIRPINPKLEIIKLLVITLICAIIGAGLVYASRGKIINIFTGS